MLNWHKAERHEWAIDGGSVYIIAHTGEGWVLVALDEQEGLDYLRHIADRDEAGRLAQVWADDKGEK